MGYWACDVNEASARSQSRASLQRSSLQPLAFLASKTIPVDGYKIRNSLYLTQPMREPAQASVNVIMHEDMQRMQEESKYKGMEEQIAQLQENIKDVDTHQESVFGVVVYGLRHVFTFQFACD